LLLALSALGCTESAVGVGGGGAGDARLSGDATDAHDAVALDRGVVALDGALSFDGALSVDGARPLDVPALVDGRVDAADGEAPLSDARPSDAPLAFDGPPGCRPEVCDGLDNDCDGEIDEAIEEIGQPCGVDEGRCRVGAWACVEGRRLCEGSIGRRDEVCNGLDDDCDGEIDEALEGAGEVCALGAGCGEGARACVEGAWGCVGPGDDTPEVCDGLDNNCDGRVDEADPRLDEPCGIDTGACEIGALQCFGGVLTCVGNIAPVDERCDGIDNDCDGTVDESDVFNHDAPCPAIGEPCRDDQSCAEGPCVDDYGDHYCSLRCDDLACPAPLGCEIRAGRSVCVKARADCRANADCINNEQCALLPPRYEGDLGARCYPLNPVGAAVGEACGGEIACANAMCLARVGHCSGLCVDTDCPEGMACSLVPFFVAQGESVDLGLCFHACQRDDDCAAGLLCQYGWRADQGAIIGVCDGPYGPEPTGGDCAAGCDHGLCYADGGVGYCTQGCTTALDCPSGWRCERSPITPTLERGVCAR
ncbi:hypothetical protein KKF91_04000, partial [Myxococcota bacterium]|nr:hypothetical protein [Myxococcota bacterium]